MSDPQGMAEAMERNLVEKTGRDLREWVEIARRTGLDKHGQIVKALKAEHALTHGYANLVAHAALRSSAADTPDDALVEAQYAGKKAGLRPIHDRLMEVVRGFGGDVEIAPKKGYVSLRRRKQFALVQPSTATRVDVGIQLKGVKPSGRLEASGSFNGMVSHRVRVASPIEVDRELEAWLRRAYDAAG